MISQATVMLQSFVDVSKATQTIWALQDPQSQDWVVCDSSEFIDTDVMPLWSSEEAASAYCTDEWRGYQVIAIRVADYLEQWASDLNHDGVLLGLNWNVDDSVSVEVEPIDVAKAFAEYESAVQSA